MFSRLLQSAALVIVSFGTAHAFETSARHAWVYDMTTHTVLMDKDADVPAPPASTSKLMTLDLLFEALKDGRVTMDTTFSVSARARSMGGSTMFLNEMDRPTVEELIHGIIINSGNDACVVVAENLAGSEEAFAKQMTQRARDLGLTHSHFANASGWPDPGQIMSAHDLGMLAVHLITTYPDLYKFFGMTGFNYKDRAPANAENRNPLLHEGGDGSWTADGMKTGHTQESGYSIVGSAVNHADNRRIVVILQGLPSETARAQEAEAVTNWAFRQFVMRTIAKSGTRLATAEVHMGSQSSVGLVTEDDLKLLIPAMSQDQMTAEAVYDGPIAAPIAKGQTLGKLVVKVPNMPDTEVPLVAEAAVPMGGFTKRLQVAAGDLVGRFFGPGDEAPAEAPAAPAASDTAGS